MCQLLLPQMLHVIVLLKLHFMYLVLAQFNLKPFNFRVCVQIFDLSLTSFYILSINIVPCTNNIYDFFKILRVSLFITK